MPRLKLLLLSIILSLPIFFFVSATSVKAATCDLATVAPSSGGQNYDVSYCVKGTLAEINSVNQVTVTCRSSALTILGQNTRNAACHEDDQSAGYPFFGAQPTSQTAPVTPVPKQATDGSYTTCYTIKNLDRNMGSVDIDTKTSNGSSLCAFRSPNITPQNYDYWQYMQNTLATQVGIGTVYNPQQNVFCIDGSVQTALGCLSFDLAGGGLIKSILTLATGIGGAIALLLMLYGFFILTTSAGIPDKIKEGQEIITSAVGGLLFIIFATVMMNLIGIKILNLPGLQ